MSSRTIIVSKVTLKEAEKCGHSHSCLENDCSDCCKVIDCVDNNIHFIKPPNKMCPYLITYGFANICACPVRTEYYNKNKK